MRHTATVTEIESLAPSVLQVTISFADDTFAFEPGQWVNFRFPEGEVSRAYTIASAPERPEALQICVRVGEGKGGQALNQLEPGASVTIEGPYGDFLLPRNEARGVVFIAGDVGIAAVRSIVLHMLATKDPRHIVVLYEPDQRNILYAGDFDPLARAGQIVHESGNIEMLIGRKRDVIKESTVMVVGFDAFLDRARRTLDDIGADSGRLIVETFGPQP